MTTEFKIGDKVRRINHSFGDLIPGDVAVVDKINNMNGTISLVGYLYHYDKIYFEPVDNKEEIKHFLKTQHWFIKTGSVEKSHAVQKWLFEHDFKWYFGTGFRNNKESLLTNTCSEGNITGNLMHGPTHKSAKEILFTFETIITNVEFPIVTTAEDLKMKELQETIDNAQKQLQELRQIKEKK